MNVIPVNAKEDFLGRFSQTTPIKAVSELIWNGLDAGAENVSVVTIENELGSIEEIHVSDSGSGIDHTKVSNYFGNLGDSWKKTTSRFNNRALHGNNGQGRFKAFTLGTSIEWKTTYVADGNAYQYSIIGDNSSLKSFKSTEPIEVPDKATGTVVSITGINRCLPTLNTDNASLELGKILATYLIQYPTVSIKYNDIEIDPTKIQKHLNDLPVNAITLESGKVVQVTLTVIEWTSYTARAIHLCDEDGISLHELSSGQQIRAPGFYFTVYIKSRYFRELDANGQLDLEELNPEVAKILDEVKRVVNSHFRSKMANEQSRVVQRWKDEKIYPFIDKGILSSVEETERQVFDIVAVNVESYLPSFEKSDPQSKKLTFRLLAQTLRDSPKSLQCILNEVFNLSADKQDDLAELLNVTSLADIITTARTVGNRLDFLAGLENLLFDKDSKKHMLERDQLHKILVLPAFWWKDWVGLWKCRLMDSPCKTVKLFSTACPQTWKARQKSRRPFHSSTAAAAC